MSLQMLNSQIAFDVGRENPETVEEKFENTGVQCF